MTAVLTSRPLLRRPWFVTLLVCGIAVSTIAVAMTFLVKNMGGMPASQPIRMRKSNIRRA